MAELSKKRQRQIRADLGAYVRKRFEEARYAKGEIYDILTQCLKQIKGERIGGVGIDPEVDANCNITSPIVRGTVGLIRDVFANSLESPFVIKASPVVDLDKGAERTVMDVLLKKYAAMQQEGIVPTDAEIEADVQENLMAAGTLEKQRLADAAAARMNTLIQDRLQDADWLPEFGDFIYNFVAYPAAILKVPAMKQKMWKEWDNETGRQVVRKRVVRSVENISPFDFYPAPYAQDVQSSEYVIERRKVTRTELATCYALPGYSKDGLDDVFELYPNGYLEPYEESEQRPDSDLEGIPSDEDGDHSKAQGAFDCLGFYGSIQGNILAAFGVSVEDENRNYEAEIWIIDDIVIKATLNPDPLGLRPFYAASFEPIPGSFWGECITTRLADTQRILTATAVAHVVNLSYASGVQGEVDESRLVDEDDPRIVIPNSLRPVVYDPKHNGMPAIRFYTVPDLSANLINVIQFHQQQAYELVGIPRVAFGSSENLGTVGRTSGGVAMVLNQASKSVKYALRILEERIIEPAVQSFIDYELFFNSDPTIKGDIRVHARGVSGLVEKENKESKLEWALQSMAPYVQLPDPETGQPIIPAKGIKALVFELFKSVGVPTDDIFPDYEFQRAVTGGSVPQAPNPMVQGATLDGRSGSAAGAIANMNSMGGGGNPQPGAL